MKEELKSLSSNNTWVLVNLPSDRKAIAKKFGVDFSEIFSPVAWWDTIRTVLSIAAARKLKLGQFDVKTAFLYEDLSEDMYMAQPEGFSDSSGQEKLIIFLVCKLSIIHQEAYCRKILSDSNHVSIPIEKGALTTDDSVSLSADVPYREAVGSLKFLAIVTTAYAVGVWINLNRCTGLWRKGS
ncbi:retrovirus-related Pol polyprotein from transposon TNT 1-94 [Trichonephila clavipes]|nr:retrovirus-related Pol polyprotein from transposon TNT 1-94 [Trichonephila clavipes]